MLNWRKQEKDTICLQGAHSLTLIIIDNTVMGMHQGEVGTRLRKGEEGGHRKSFFEEGTFSCLKGYFGQTISCYSLIILTSCFLPLRLLGVFIPVR